MGSEPLSIVHVFDGKYTPGEGVPSYIKTLGAYCSALGHEVNYVVGQSDIHDTEIHSLGRTVNVKFNGNNVDIPLWTPRKQVQQVLDELKPDVLHIHMPYSPFLGARFVARASAETAVFGTFHIYPDSSLVRVGSRALSLINRTSQQRVDQIVSVSTAAQSFARSAFGLESEVVGCPIDINLFSHGTKLPEYDDQKTNIVFMGRLVERKGCGLLLEAISRLDNSLKAKLRVLVAGRGPLMEQLKAQVLATGLESVVTFLGFVEDAVKPSVLASADIAVFPATGGESFGIVLLEAMASSAGVVIGGDNEGYKQVLNNNQDFLVDPTNALEFSHRLRHLITDPIERSKLHQEQQEIVSAYDISNIGPKIVDIYRRLLVQRHSR